MATPNIIWESKEERQLHEKNKVESLKKRLNDIILKDPVMAKKAALVIEQWLKKTRP